MSTHPQEIWRKTRWAIKSAIDVANLPSLRANKRLLDGITRMPELISALCRKRGKNSIVADQIISEISVMADMLAARRPKVIVEIGTAKGGTLYLWTRLCQDGGLVISIDKPGEMGSVRAVNRSVYRTFGRERGVKVHTLPMDSHSPRTHHRLAQILGSQKIDFLFIDGDHSYQGVKADYEGYLPFMTTNGVIAMHDIAIPLTDSWIKVQQFWNELQAQGLNTRAIVASQGEKRGIGVVFLG